MPDTKELITNISGCKVTPNILATLGLRNELQNVNKQLKIQRTSISVFRYGYTPEKLEMRFSLMCILDLSNFRGRAKV
jgi:hypothetical protein